jgi:hypothetical protein
MDELGLLLEAMGGDGEEGGGGRGGVCSGGGAGGAGVVLWRYIHITYLYFSYSFKRTRTWSGPLCIQACENEGMREIWAIVMM